MKKVLIYNGYYYPAKNCGGPITSIENIVNACCDEFEFYIICYNHDFNDDAVFDVPTSKWLDVGNAKVMYVNAGYLDFSAKRTGMLYEELKPDLIWFSGVLTPNNKIVAVKNARQKGIPILFSPRGEVSADRVKIKGYKKVPYLSLLKVTGMYKNCYFHGTSDDEENGIKKYFNPDDSHIFRVANIAIMQQPKVQRNAKKKDEIRLFFFSRIHEVKNLMFAIKAVNNCKSKVVYDIYGPIESKEYWDECKNEIDKSPQNISINYCGILQHNNMSKVIQGYDAFLFPTINENYGHVIAESLANSRPVILSKGTTPWDDLDKVAGCVIDLSDLSGFTDKVDYLAEFDEEQYLELINSTKRYFMQKIGKDKAIEGHKLMIRKILNLGGE